MLNLVNGLRAYLLCSKQNDIQSHTNLYSSLHSKMTVQIAVIQHFAISLKTHLRPLIYVDLLKFPLYNCARLLGVLFRLHCLISPL